MNTIYIILTSPTSQRLAQSLQTELQVLYSDATINIGRNEAQSLLNATDAIVFIGTIDTCVRSISPMVSESDSPAVVCIDAAAHYIVPILMGKANEASKLATELSSATGGTAILTTAQSDESDGTWALDTLAQRFGWRCSLGRRRESMGKVIAAFASGKATALILDADDEGAQYLNNTAPHNVTIFRSYSDYTYYVRRKHPFAVLIIVSPRIHPAQDIPTVQYFPLTLHLGVGCQKQASPAIAQQLLTDVRTAGFSPDSIASISTIDDKKDEPLFASLQKLCPRAHFHSYPANKLAKVKVPNPSDRIFQSSGCYCVAEAAALIANPDAKMVVENQKGKICVEEKYHHYTFAVAQAGSSICKGRIEYVGAGPGDPGLITFKGRKLLIDADLIIYDGSFAMRKLTNLHKPGALVRSITTMTLDEQLKLMKEHYDKGMLVVNLIAGSPNPESETIKKQQAFFEENGISINITPGIKGQ